MSDWTGWIEIVAESAALALSFVGVFEGARRLVLRGFSRAIALMLAVGLAIPVYEAWASQNVARVALTLSRAAPSRHADEPPGGWEKADMSPAERTARSTDAAKINFLLSGKRTTYVDLDGNRVSFIPSQQDLDDRDGLVRGEKNMEDVSQQFNERGARLLASLTTFLLVGLVVGWRQRRSAA